MTKRCSYWLSELARQGGPPLQCRLKKGHDGPHEYGPPAEYVHVCMREDLVLEKGGQQ